jgi:peptide deformylase
MAQHDPRDDESDDTSAENEGEFVPPLVTLGHPRLAQPSAPVALELVRSDEFRERLRTLYAAMVAYRGIGIAAPQIGWFERFFLMGIALDPNARDDGDDTPEGEPEPRIALQPWINPEIVAVSAEQGWAWEGCLSVPGLRGWIRRPLAVAVRGYDGNGEPISREYTGWAARVFQHEYDHLEGYLFPYRALDPRHVVAIEQLARRDEWPGDWPAKGAARAPFGEVMAED